MRPRMPTLISVDYILKAKLRWRVSAMALTHRLHTLNLLSDWQYKSTCIELTRRGYRTGEPGGVEREVFALCLAEGACATLGGTKDQSSCCPDALHIPLDSSPRP